MKKVLFALFSVGFVLCSFTFLNTNNDIVTNKLEVKADEPGIAFQKISYKEALAQAKKEGKLIFIDAYASWCGPCKLMARTTFKDAKVSEYFNKKFINLSVDMEKDPDGAYLTKTFQVMAYPTLLFVDGNGKLVYQTLGFQNADAFMKNVQTNVK